MNSVSINYVELNKASSLLIAYWTVNNMIFDQLSDAIIQNQANIHQKELNDMIIKDRNEIEEQIQDLNEMEQAMERSRLVSDPVEKLKEVNYQKQLELEAEIQKRLTKSVPYLRGQLVNRLGLRYAPEIRFYRDNTTELYKD